jgi:di/tricarboxylate transporter
MAIGFFGNIPGLENVITFNFWLQAFLVPSALLTAFFIFGLYKFVKPAEKLNIDPNSFKKGWEVLGPITFAEKATLVILLITFLLLVTAQYTSISDVAICLGAFVLLSVVGVIKPKDIGSGISWDLVIFLGAVMGLSLVFQETGISKFLSNSFLPLISSLAVSHWVILFAALLALFAWRFLDVAQLLPTIPFLVPLLPMLMANFGINPLIMFLLFVMAGNFFFFAYQQPFAILGESLAGQAAWTAGQLRAAGIIYVGACLATLALSIPYWMLVGLIK